MDILTADRVELLKGIRLTKGTLLDYQFIEPELPQGFFAVIGEGQPTLNGMGESVQLIFSEGRNGSV
jgi:hypothetical protein